MFLEARVLVIIVENYKQIQPFGGLILWLVSVLETLIFVFYFSTRLNVSPAISQI